MIKLRKRLAKVDLNGGIMMSIINFGIYQYKEEEFETPCFVEKDTNKINGGIWACPENEYYSDWIAIAPFIAVLTSPNALMCSSRIVLKREAKRLTLTPENYKNFTDENDTLLFEKIKDFDCIHFSKALVEEVEAFEAYYVESYQILNLECIHDVYFIELDLDYMKSEVYVRYAFKRVADVMKHVMNTSICKELLCENGL